MQYMDTKYHEILVLAPTIATFVLIPITMVHQGRRASDEHRLPLNRGRRRTGTESDEATTLPRRFENLSAEILGLSIKYYRLFESRQFTWEISENRP